MSSRSEASKLCARANGWGSGLPFELVEEILEKNPIEDLLRAKSICKDWYGLIKDTRFIYKHLDLSRENKKRFIRIYRDMVQIMNPVTQDLLSLPVPAEFLAEEFAGFQNNNTIITAIHCDGLLLCHCSNGMNKRRLAVWNPVLSNGRVKWIEPLSSYHFLDGYGFGYDNEKKYKILRFNSLGKVYEIYDLKSKHWRVFLATFDWRIFRPCQNVSMKGNMYWIAETREKSEMFIQSFDFSRETFKPICSSLPVDVGQDVSFITRDLVRFRTLDAIVLSDFGGHRLSLLHQHDVGDSITKEIKMEVWVTNKLSDGVVSWSKYLNVTCPHLPILPLSHRSSGDPTYFINQTNGIVLWCDKVVKPQEDDDEDVQEASVSFYEICDGEIKKQVETGPPYAGTDSTCICGLVYVPSLVPVPELKIYSSC